MHCGFGLSGVESTCQDMSMVKLSISLVFSKIVTPIGSICLIDISRSMVRLSSHLQFYSEANHLWTGDC